MGGAAYHVNNPKCFVAGTLIVTALGMSCVEDIRPGDYVYAKNEITGEQAYMPVLQTYENEIDVTYTITIDGESIETTAGHPFYTTDEGWTGADKLKAGDEVELSDGSSGTVESVERNELDEPVTIYNFTVMDYHTYYVGENEVLVHNANGLCGIDAAKTIPQQLTRDGQVPAIGKMKDLNTPGKVVDGEFKVADYLPDMGNPKDNWKQNSGILRSVMNEGVPIKDVSPFPMEKAGFLGAERNLLQSKGLKYSDGYWYSP